MSSNNLKKILFLGASPYKLPPLKIDEESDTIENIVTKRHSKYEFKKEINVTNKKLTKAIRKLEPEIIHFSGHGEERFLITHKINGLPDQLSNEALCEIIVKTKSVKGVILNCCYSQDLADMLYNINHIDFVIGTTKRVLNDTCLEFSDGFYESFAFGKSPYKSFTDGRLTIIAENQAGKDDFIFLGEHKENDYKESGNPPPIVQLQPKVNRKKLQDKESNNLSSDKPKKEAPPKNVKIAIFLIILNTLSFLIMVFLLEIQLPNPDSISVLSYLIPYDCFIYLLTYQIYLGKNWARIIITVFFSFFSLKSLLYISYSATLYLSEGNYMALLGESIYLILSAATIIYLYSKKSKIWFSNKS